MGRWVLQVRAPQAIGAWWQRFVEACRRPARHDRVRVASARKMHASRGDRLSGRLADANFFQGHDQAAAGAAYRIGANFEVAFHFLG